MSLRQRCIAFALTMGILVPAIVGAQSPWAVTLTPTMDPLPAGFCAAIHLTIFDASGGDVPRNPVGYRVTMADFDIAVTSPSGTAAAAQRIDASHWSACACQSAAPGTVATVIATYPAQALAANARVPGVTIQRAATFALAAPKGTTNPPACSAPGNPPVVASATGAGAPPSQPPSTSSPLTSPPGRVPASTAPPTTTGSPPPGTPPPVATGGVTQPPKTGTANAPPPTSSTAAAPVPVNPSGFLAVESGPGQVSLSWQPVTAASYYVLFGPGSTAGGVKVQGATTFVVTGVPAGAQEWSLASYYEPGPVSTPSSAFTKAKATVTSTVAATPPTSTPQTSRYRVVATGFRVVKEAVDDQLDRDGLRNEVYGAFSMFHFRNGSDYELLDKDLRRTLVHGDNLKHPDRVRAGSASMTGGLRDGDAFPSDPTLRVGAIGDQGFPFSVWEGALTDGSDFEIVFPTVWEWNGNQTTYDSWFANLLTNAPSMWSAAKAGMSGTTNADAILSFGTFNAAGSPSLVDRVVHNVGLSLGTLTLGLIDFSTRDRPIGMQPTGLPSQGLLLTRSGIEGSLNAVGGAGPTRVSLTIPFVDDPTQPKLRGSYILYLQVERMP